MRYALAMVLLASATYAAEVPPHARSAGGGWYDCEPGYVMTRGACISEPEIAANAFEVSSLPSAGEGAPGTCPSGGCAQPAPRIIYQQRTPVYYSYPVYTGRIFGASDLGHARIGSQPCFRTSRRSSWRSR